MASQNILEFTEYLQRSNLSVNTQQIIIKNTIQYLESGYNIYGYRDMLKQKYSSSTCNMKIYSVNKWLAFNNCTDKLKSIPMPKNKNLENVISLEEYRSLLDYIKKKGYIEEYLAIRTLGCTGMRPFELFKIQSNDIDKGYAKICSKREKTRNIYFTPLLRKDLTDYIKSNSINGKVFDMTLDHLRYIMRLGTKIGIDRSVLYPYSLRHMFGKAFISRNPNLAMLSDIMGHENIETTRIYTRLTIEEQKQALTNIVDWDF